MEHNDHLVDICKFVYEIINESIFVFQIPTFTVFPSYSAKKYNR